MRTLQKTFSLQTVLLLSTALLFQHSLPTIKSKVILTVGHRAKATNKAMYVTLRWENTPTI